MIINTKEDLDSIAGTSEYKQFMTILRGSLFSIRNDESTNRWVADESNDVIERFGLTRADFEPIEQPVLPANKTLNESKQAKKEQIRAEFDWFNQQPVVDADGIGWAGGFNSSLMLDGARRMSEQVGLADVTFYDDANSAYVLLIADAINVILLVANEASVALGQKNALYDDVMAALNLDEVAAIVSPWTIP